MMDLDRNLTTLAKHPGLANEVSWLDDAATELTWYEKQGRSLEMELELQRDIFEPLAAYDEDGDILEDRVWLHIGLLLSGYPNANPGNAEAYLGAMVGEVLTLRISEVSLKLACSQIRKTSTFPPSTAEVVEAIKQQERLWEKRSMAISGCETVAEYLRKGIQAATEAIAALDAQREEDRRLVEEKKRADEALRALPLVVGDRVSSPRGDRPAGVIVDIRGQGADVVFDDAKRQQFDLKSLTRLLPDETSYKVNKYDAEAQQYRQKLPVVGDRIFHHELGPGTVVRYSESEDFRIKFDSCEHRTIWRAEWTYLVHNTVTLRRVLFGDAYFVAGQAV
jgi:hypothetical protein